MLIYAFVIAVTRLVLLAHHPSDVVAGALLGVIGAMFVRYWFAARHLAFKITRDGEVEPLGGPSWERLKSLFAGRLFHKNRTILRTRSALSTSDRSNNELVTLSSSDASGVDVSIVVPVRNEVGKHRAA